MAISANHFEVLWLGAPRPHSQIEFDRGSARGAATIIDQS